MNSTEDQVIPGQRDLRPGGLFAGCGGGSPRPLGRVLGRAGFLPAGLCRVVPGVELLLLGWRFVLWLFLFVSGSFRGPWCS